MSIEVLSCCLTNTLWMRYRFYSDLNALEGGCINIRVSVHFKSTLSILKPPLYFCAL
jgi:hypothetical protein